jgi:hypothetical protein
VRFALATLRVAEAELQQATEAIRKAPGAITRSEMRRLEHAVELAQLEVEKAKTLAAKPRDGREAEADAEQQIRKALNEKTTVEFNETPLIDVFEFLAAKHKITIHMDTKALDDAGIGADTPISRSLRNLSLRSTLSLLLRDLDLTYLVTDEVLLITTKDEANQRLTTVVYDVRDLLEHDRRERSQLGDDTPGFDYDTLIENITATVGPTTWDEVGGPGSIGPLYGTLVISQTAAIHEEIAQLLKAIRDVVSKPAKGAAERPAVERIEPAEPQAPADPNALLLRVYPIANVSGWMGGGFGAQGRAGSPFRSGVLGQFGGGSSQSENKESGIGGLVQPGATRITSEQINELAELVAAMVEPKSWVDKGGPGTIRGLPTIGTGTAALVVLQTSSVHARIERLLSDLRNKDVLASPLKGGGFF